MRNVIILVFLQLQSLRVLVDYQNGCHFLTTREDSRSGRQLVSEVKRTERLISKVHYLSLFKLEQKCVVDDQQYLLMLLGHSQRH
jgi:hypothetical protein